jgi:hypothetical protein
VASISFGVLLMAAGFVLREERASPTATFHSTPTAAGDAPPALEEPEQPSETDDDAPVLIALGLVVAASALLLIAGYALHRVRRR